MLRCTCIARLLRYDHQPTCFERDAMAAHDIVVLPNTEAARILAWSPFIPGAAATLLASLPTHPLSTPCRQTRLRRAAGHACVLCLSASLRDASGSPPLPAAAVAIGHGTGDKKIRGGRKQQGAGRTLRCPSHLRATSSCRTELTSNRAGPSEETSEEILHRER